jgi:hypothetical protein
MSSRGHLIRACCEIRKTRETREPLCGEAVPKPIITSVPRTLELHGNLSTTSYLYTLAFKHHVRMGMQDLRILSTQS